MKRQGYRVSHVIKGDKETMHYISSHKIQHEQVRLLTSSMPYPSCSHPAELSERGKTCALHHRHGDDKGCSIVEPSTRYLDRNYETPGWID